MKEIPKVAVVMGSKSDWPTVQKVKLQLDELEIPNDTYILSAHRTPKETMLFATSARDEGYGVIIACAGMAAHLAGAIAAWTTIPVIGLPLKAKQLDGVDALLSSVQMPPGIPVAVVGIDSASNAALMAAEILAVSNPEITEKLEKKRNEETQKVLEAILD